MEQVWPSDVAAIRFSPACDTVYADGISYSTIGLDESKERTNREIHQFVSELGLPETGFLTWNGVYFPR